MLQRFENFITKQNLFKKEQKLLLALSGGVDSMCLFHLLQLGGYNFSVAHCNFQLRGEESEADMDFVVEVAKSKSIPLHLRSFETKEISISEKKGIQEVARYLRYQWFNELIESESFDKLLTAHHLTDNAETMLINMMRSTGIKGLHGIPLNENRIARPLMFATRNEIESYLKRENIQFREDSSNASDYYLRNQIRHFVMPAIKQIQTDVEQRFFETAQKVKAYETMSEELIGDKWRKLTETMDGNIRIDLNKLSSIQNKEMFLYFNVKKYGFTANQIRDLLVSVQIGKKVLSDKYELIKERNYLLLQLLTSQPKKFRITLNENDEMILYNSQTIEIHILNRNIAPDFTREDTLYLNADRISFPITLRTWEEGDKIKPLGMKGYKKISDILTDKKVDNSKRSSFLVLEQYDNEVIGLIPLVVSENNRIDGGTTKILSITLNMA